MKRHAIRPHQLPVDQVARHLADEQIAAIALGIGGAAIDRGSRGRGDESRGRRLAARHVPVAGGGQASAFSTRQGSGGLRR